MKPNDDDAGGAKSLVVTESAPAEEVTACDVDIKLNELSPLLLPILLSVGDGIIFAASPILGSMVVVGGGDDRKENAEELVAVGAAAAVASP